ncbi:MAG: DNA mismatch repair endonuclease MutL [Thermodesulfovibrionales bacterium]
MSRIKILSEALQNKIAAGEVIERPASIMKELVENALDAGSTDVRVEFLKGGKRLIRVNDDGIGMDHDDVLLCFQKHATSKIADESDLNSIATMGFRGEALSSIASVSRVKIKSSARGSSEGTEVEIAGGEVKTVKDISTLGTTIEVRDLFFNTPARKKFLKTDHTEQYHIIDTVTRAAIINSGIAFSLSEAKRTILRLHVASNMKERLVQIYGTEFMNRMIWIEHHQGSSRISLEGFISGTDNARKRRTNQYLFVNGRPIMDVSLRHAISKAYEGHIDNDAHPMFFLNVILDPESTDVNVHPTKREIRFLEKEQVYDTLLGSLREALVNELSSERTIDETVPSLGRKAGGKGYHIKSDNVYITGLSEGIPDMVSETVELSYTVDKPFLYLGDVFVAYADSGRLCIIDHHAAHERVLYERLRDDIRTESYGLLFPKQVRLGAKEYSVLIEYKEVLNGMGFDIDDFGGSTIIVRALPDVVNEEGLEGLLSDIATSIMSFRSNSPVDDIKDEMAKRIACHSSVRGRKILDREQIQRLLKDLDSAEDPHHCPHGRPTRTYFSLDDLRRLFERT